MTNQPDLDRQSVLRPSVVCVLVHWNNLADTSACLASLALEDYPALKVLVVDNASTDGSLEVLQTNYPWAIYIANSENAGFPKACNLGMSHPLASAAEFVWLLNNDTIVPRGTLSAMVTLAQSEARLGVVGSILRYLHPPHVIQAWGGGHVNRWTGQSHFFMEPAAFRTGSYLTFASVLIRQAVLDDIGDLYEGAFMYYEDADFCFRARAAGWELGVATDTAILHRDGGTSKPKSPATVRIVTTAGLLFLKRYSPFPPLSYAIFCTLRLGKRLVQGDVNAIRAVVVGIRDFARRR